MADNDPVARKSDGTTTPVATDQRPDGSHVQWLKMMFGVDGTFLPVSSSDPMPVDVYGGVALEVNGGYVDNTNQLPVKVLNNVAVTLTGTSPVSVSGTTAVSSVPATSIGNNQSPISVSRGQLPSVACREVTILALPTNTSAVYVGGSTVTAATGFYLAPGAAITYKVDNCSRVYVIAASGSPVISWTWEA